MEYFLPGSGAGGAAEQPVEGSAVGTAFHANAKSGGYTETLNRFQQTKATTEFTKKATECHGKNFVNFRGFFRESPWLAFDVSLPTDIARTTPPSSPPSPPSPPSASAAWLTGSPTGRSAMATPSSSVHTQWKVSCLRTSSGMSSMSASLSFGRMIVVMPARCAPSTFSFTPADRQHAAAQRDLAGHRDVATHRPPRHRAHERRRDRDAGARPVLRDRARRHVHVHLDRAESVLGNLAASTRASPRR